MKKIDDNSTESSHTSSSKAIVTANNLFTVDLYSRYKSKEGNVFFSPYSVMSALAMAYEGAKGKTADEMRKVLHLSENQENTRLGFAELSLSVGGEHAHTLSVANALWVQKKYKLVDEYVDSIKKNYGGQVENLDFVVNTEKSREIINDWVAGKTNDKIRDLIPSGMLSADTKLVLTNAIYFKAEWEPKFKENDTTDEVFKVSVEHEVDVEMMHRKGKFNYAETKDLQILEMDYKGDDLSMIVILPKDNDIAGIESTISVGELDRLREAMQMKKVIVSFPKFKFDCKYMMANDLEELGMRTAFKSPGADFTGISLDHELMISEVVHQTFIEVAEDGTEAAGATAVVMVRGAMRQPGEIEVPKIFNADHPFMFMIQKKDTGHILFMGRVSDPS